MVNVALKVIPEPAEGTRTVIDTSSDLKGPAFTGQGEVNYLCGECGLMLAEGMESAAQISNMVIRCWRCESFNETRT